MRLVSLGDSFSCGEGVGLRVDPDQTWVGLLATGLAVSSWTALATAGARTHQVRSGQLADALAARADLATVLVGLNDLGRPGFRAGAVAADLRAVVLALRDSGSLVLLGRLHDPARQLPLPGPLRRGLAARRQVVNGAVDALATEPGVHVVDLGAVPELADPASWAVDRLHPSAAGHRAMARAAAQVLRGAGLAVSVAAAPPGPVPSALAQARWLVAHGLPWGAAHLHSIGLPILAAAAGLTRSGEPVPAAGAVRSGA